MHTNACDYPGNHIPLQTPGVYEKEEGMLIQGMAIHYSEYLKMCLYDNKWSKACGHISEQ